LNNTIDGAHACFDPAQWFVLGVFLMLHHLHVVTQVDGDDTDVTIKSQIDKTYVDMS